MGGAASKVLTHVVQDAAVHRLSQSKTFQNIAVRTVDTVTAAHKALEETARKTAADPAESARALQSGAQSFLGHLKAEVMKDVSAWGGGAKAAPPPARTGPGRGDGPLA